MARLKLKSTLRRLLSLNVALFVWNVAWFIANVRYWLDNPPWGWLGVGFFGFFILSQVYRFGYDRAARSAMRQLIAQQHALDEMKTELEHTGPLRLVSIDATRPGEIGVRTYICLN